ncbi:MAG: geranylgeranylglyceryl/heptaprenylglyceryl phosphate synthase [Candidatus Zixiibacteriota bacterium]|nr:MAG: geranylgeranylglyceryl/heptaprenylglyceryl phosphate synthase [candidate division Zixibacteria bacterium]
MSVFDTLMQIRTRKGGGFLLLLDPDRTSEAGIVELAGSAEEYGVDALLVGTSLAINDNFHAVVSQVKSLTALPVIIFPGAHSQISPDADAVLFTSLLSGRNPQYLIEEQVRGAPIVKAYGVEPIATGYLLIESGKYTSVQYMSNSFPIPAGKKDIACAHALAAQYLGMQTVFLDAGSGAERSVPEAMVEAVAGYVDLPLIIGGGIRTPREVEQKITAGASFVVVGDHFEKTGDRSRLREFASAAHLAESVRV